MLVIRNVTFMTTDPRSLADFWAAALGFTERRDDDDETIIAAADWTHPRLTFQRVTDGERRPRTMHLDLTADDRQAEIERLRGLGATEGRSFSMQGGWTWTVMADPDGNEFCVTDP